MGLNWERRTRIGNRNGSKNNNEKNHIVDKRFKILPPLESLPRNETVGGYIFVCNNDTVKENLHIVERRGKWGMEGV